MDLNLNGKRALVFGASSGIGKAVAEALVREGARVAICARRLERLEATAREIGAELSLQCDLSLPGEASSAVRKVLNAWGGVDILVTNTGGPPKGNFEEISEDAWRFGFQSLWLSVIEAIQDLLPSMRAQRWGRILLITSMAAKEPAPGLTISNGLRAGLLGLTKSLSNEVAADGITVNSILPGFIRTERLIELGLDETAVARQIPAGRVGEPRELAALAAFLASSQASYITGQSIACDGGKVQCS